jgi:hypothetical protein
LALAVPLVLSAETPRGLVLLLTVAGVAPEVQRALQRVVKMVAVVAVAVELQLTLVL